MMHYRSECSVCTRMYHRRILPRDGTSRIARPPPRSAAIEYDLFINDNWKPEVANRHQQLAVSALTYRVVLGIVM